MITGRARLLSFYDSLGKSHWRVWNGQSYGSGSGMATSRFTGQENRQQLVNLLNDMGPGFYSIKFAGERQDPDKPIAWNTQDGTAFEILASEQTNTPAVIGSPHGGTQVQHQERMYSRDEMDERLEEKIKIMKLEHRLEEVANKGTDWVKVIEAAGPHISPLLERLLMPQEMAAVAGPGKGMHRIGTDTGGNGQNAATVHNGQNNGTAVETEEDENATVATAAQVQRMNALIDRMDANVFKGDTEAMIVAITKVVEWLEKDPSKVKMIDALKLM